MHVLLENKPIQLSCVYYFRSLRGIGQVAKEMCFGKDISLKFAGLDAKERERWSIISEAQLKVHFPKIFENVSCPQGINHSRFH